MTFVEYKSEKYFKTQWNDYFVSKKGNVYSNKTKRLLTPVKDRDGYLRVTLSLSNKLKRSISIHRMVATTFLGYRNCGFVVDHIDRDKTNNNLTNLRYISNSQNISISHKNVKPKLKISCTLIKDGQRHHFDSITKMYNFLGLKRHNYVSIMSGAKKVKNYLILGYKKTGSGIEMVIQSMVDQVAMID